MVKSVNGVVFIGFGIAIAARIATYPGITLVQMLPGLALGAALIGLGLYRTIALVRSRG